MKGRTHEALALPLGTLAALPWALNDPHQGVLFLGAYTASTLFLSPDLDLPNSRPSRRWGPLGLLWLPYRLLHPHRGLSHTYLYGPLSRLLYLALLTLPLLGLLGVPPGKALDLLLTGLARHPGEAFALLMGYLLGQWVHLLQDRIPPGRPARGLRR